MPEGRVSELTLPPGGGAICRLPQSLGTTLFGWPVPSRRHRQPFEMPDVPQASRRAYRNVQGGDSERRRKTLDIRRCADVGTTLIVPTLRLCRPPVRIGRIARGSASAGRHNHDPSTRVCRLRSRVAGWTWIGATERGEGRRDSNSPVYTPKQPATRSVATLVLGGGAGSASLARRWQTSGRATGLCRPTGGGSLNPQAIQPQGRHNQKVGTIGDRGADRCAGVDHVA